MTRDIRSTIRQVAENDSARAIIATAAGELIKKLGAPRRQIEQRDGRILASGLGGFAAGAGAVTVASATARGIGKLVGRSRRPLFADVPKKAAAGTRKAVEVPREAVDRFASGLRDQIGGRGESSRGGSHGPPRTRSGGAPAKRPRRASTTGRAATTAKTARKPTASSGRSTAKSSRSTNGGSGRSTAKRTTRSTSASRPRSSAKSTRSTNASSGRTRAATRGSTNGRH